MRTFGDFELLETLPSSEPRVLRYTARSAGNAGTMELRVTSTTVDAGAEEAARERLAALRELSHPHLVPIRELGLCEGSVFHLTDTRPTVSLAKYLAVREGQLGPEVVLDLLLPVGEALRQLHRAGHVHGDLSLETLRIEEASERVYLETLSLSRLLGTAAAEDAARSEVSAAIATPEQDEGLPVDARTDVLLFASVLYQALTPRRIPPARVRRGQARQVLSGLVPASSLSEKLPEEIDGVFSRALAYDPGSRHASLGDLLEALGPVKAAVRREVRKDRRPSKAIHMEGLKKKRLQQEVAKELARRARERREGEDEQGLARWWTRLGVAAKLALFFLLMIASTSLPLFDDNPAFVLAPAEPTAPPRQPPERMSRQELSRGLRALAASVQEQPTVNESFGERMRLLRTWALKVLSKEERDELEFAKKDAELQTTFATNAFEACLLLDRRARDYQAFVEELARREEEARRATENPAPTPPGGAAKRPEGLNRAETALFDLADQVWRQGTTRETFQERWGKLWKFGASLSPEEQASLMDRGKMMEIRKLFVKDSARGASELDSLVRECQAHVKAEYSAP